VLEGTLDAALDVRGTLENPTAAGTAALTNVRIAERVVPDGRFTVRLAPLHARVAGTLGPTLSIEGEGDARRKGTTAKADLTFRDFAVSPWLPQPFDQLISSVTGQSHVSVEPDQPPRAKASLRVAGPAGNMAVDGTLTASNVDGTVRG